MRERLLWLAAVGFLIVQVALPIRQLTRERPARWGWQMFSAPSAITEIQITFPDTVEGGAPGRFLPYHRREIRPSSDLADRLCGERPGATSVRLLRKGRIRLARACP